MYLVSVEGSNMVTKRKLEMIEHQVADVLGSDECSEHGREQGMSITLRTRKQIQEQVRRDIAECCGNDAEGEGR